jgi:lysozyme
MTGDDLDALRAELVQDEGLRLTPYSDTVGKVTIGYGRNLTDVGISREEASYLLQNDIAGAVGALHVKCPWFPTLSGLRQRVLINLTINCGIEGVLGFRRMIAALRIRDWDEAANELLDSDAARKAPSRYQRLARQLRTDQP